jgi:hypothetical protein
MADRVASHYSENLELADVIAQNLQSAGRDLNRLTTADLATVDEFHIRGRKATLELAAQMNLNTDSPCSRHRKWPGRTGANTGRNVRLPGDRHRFDSGIL